MAAEEERRWSWFCRNTNTTRGSAELIGNECMVNFAIFVLHLLYVIIATVVLLSKGFYISHYQVSRYNTRWPGHIGRWITSSLLFLCAIASIAEGILTEIVRNDHGNTQLQFYLPGCLLFIAISMSLLYNRAAEKWHAPRMCWLTMIYWVFCIILNLWHITMLVRQEVVLDAAVLWIAALQTVFFSVLLLIEFYLIFNIRAITIKKDVRDGHMRYTEDLVSFLYYITFWWMNWLFRLGYQRPLEINDLGTLPENHRAQHLYEIFKRDFHKEIDYKATTGGTPSVWKIFGRVYRGEIFYAGVSRLVYDLMCLIGPLALNGVVMYATDYGKTKEVDPHPYVTVSELFQNGYVLIGVIFLCNIGQYFSFQQNLYQSNIIGIHIRTSLQTMVYDKALRLSSYSISGGSMTVGQITNHMSVDAYNMFFFSQRLHYLWAVPFRLITVSCLLYLQVSYATFLALCALLIAVPSALLTSHIQNVRQRKVMKHSDERMKQSNEMMLGIKLLKMYGWEEMFCKAIEAVRKLEMSSIFSYNGCYCINVCIVWFTPILMNLAVYISYPYITGKPLEPNITFAALALMNLLLEPLYFVPMVTSLLVNAYVGARRLQLFFLAPEAERSHEIVWNEYFSTKEKVRESKRKASKQQRSLGNPSERTPLLQETEEPPIRETDCNGVIRETDCNGVISQTDQEYSHMEEITDDTYAIKIQDGDFTWGDTDSAPILKNINLVVPYGEITMIIGGVGSGKSSLLSAILGEMTTVKGSINFGDILGGESSTPYSGVAYGAQKAWLKNATLRDNILFGLPFNRQRYHKVIEACALKPDIDILPGGDMTEIGEKGINLSGGQKQRVSVARAIYSNKPIVLLDDPLSALDVNVGAQLFHKGILHRLRKAKRTVVLVTHQLQYLQEAEQTIIMKDGEIHFQGTFDELARKDPDMYKKWQQEVEAASESELSADTGWMSGEESTIVERKELQKRVNRHKRESVTRITDMSWTMVNKFGISEGGTDIGPTGNLIEKEDLARGSVASNTYWYYISNMGLVWTFFFFAGRFAVEGINVTRNFWLSGWAEAGLDPNRTVASINDEYIVPFLAIGGVGFVMFSVVAVSQLFSTWNAAGAVHLKMLRNITRSPNRFFDTTPIGRILNRFSSDTQIIDTKLIITLGSLSHFFSTFIFAIVVNAIITPIFLIEIIPIIITYAILAVFFIRSSRELQRLDSVTRSPVFAHFSETLGGLTTIRAYREQKHFFQTLLKRIDTNNTAFQYLQAGYGWLGLQMSICGGVMVLMVGLTTVLQATTFGSLDSSKVGLALSYVLMVSLQLFNLIRFAADTEMQMNPVERVQFYADTPTENYDGRDPPQDWPSRGEIRLEDVSVRYAKTLPPVIHDVELSAKPGEKVGICGRTGSGKSSLTLALLRIIDTFRGKIIIDGEDIAGLPLTTLRQRLSIIPQDPVLFTGTIRSNLDPLNSKTDHELWEALEIAQLKPMVSDFGLGLDALVTEGGENFSVGQRQLFCLARAFLRNSRVLIMDEATASIDYTTEQLLQTVVASAFKDKTVLTIAHRVSTIQDSDTIWVLRDGRVIECDSPKNLLANPNSEFYSMVQANL